MKANLPDWAEQKFALLCVEAGAVCNKAHQDRTGWDYFVEFAAAALPTLPHDMQAVERAARVQIKSKRRGKPTTTVKLSNALRFAKVETPCFVVLFAGQDGGVPRVYAKHFWADLVAATLKAAREADAAGRPDLNRIRLGISFGPTDERSSDLLAWMARTIESVGPDYGAMKLGLARTAGFEEGSFRGSIKLLASSLPAFVDHQIGLTPNAPIERVTVTNYRFGIPTRQPLLDDKPDMVRMQSHPQPCRVRIRGGAGRDVWLDAQHYLPALPNLPLEMMKSRIVADFVEIVIAGSGKATVDVSYDAAEARSLTDLRRLIEALRHARAGPIECQIVVEGRGVLDFGGAVALDDDMPTDALSDLLRPLEAVADGLAPAELRLSIGDLLRAWDNLADFGGFVLCRSLGAKFELDAPLPAEAAFATQLGYAYVEVGDWWFGAVVARDIDRVTGGPRAFDVECRAPRVLDALVRPSGQASNLEELRSIFDRNRSRLGDGVMTLFGGDLKAALGASGEVALTG